MSKPATAAAQREAQLLIDDLGWAANAGRKTKHAIAARFDAFAMTTSGKALLRYGRHTSNCRHHTGHDCDCGWDEAQADARKITKIEA